MALLSAMVVAASVAVLALALATQGHSAALRTGTVLDGDDAFLHALGVNARVAAVLEEDLRDGTSDHRAEAWARPLSVAVGREPASSRSVLPGSRALPPGTRGRTVAHVIDLDARLNLNNLIHEGRASPADVAAFRRLLALLGLAPGLADAIVDWLDPDQRVTAPDGAEDDHYLGLAEPYLTAGRPLVALGELRQVKGMGEHEIDRLLPHVTALPARTRVNVNTASPVVLRSLIEELSPVAVNGLVDRRAHTPFHTVEKFLSDPALVGARVPVGAIDVASRFFEVQARIPFGRGRTELHSVLRRDPGGSIAVVWQVIHGG